MHLERLELALSLMQAQSRTIGKGLAHEISGLAQEQSTQMELEQIHQEIKDHALEPECEAIFEFALRLNVPITNISINAFQDCFDEDR